VRALLRTGETEGNSSEVACVHLLARLL
jgi:hypothetical protein